MDELDLDAELLAVTDAPKRSRKPEISDGSDSDGGEFGGVADSDGGDDDDDDDGLDDDGDDDDDDDDREFGLADDDDDDEDYGSKSKAKKTKGRGAKGKKASSKTKPKPKGKSSTSRKASVKKRAPSLPSDDDDEGEQFEYKYDQDGYGDSEDRDRLAKMNEVDRETLLAERVDARKQEYDLWKKGQEIMAREAVKGGSANAKRMGRSSGRNKASFKSDAIKDIAEDIRKRTSRAIEEVSDADSELEGKPKRVKDEEVDREYKAEAKVEDDEGPVHDDEGPELRFPDMTKFNKDGVATTSPLFLRRNILAELSQQPYFARVVQGLFVRIKVADARPDSDGMGSYLLARIVGVETGKIYDILTSAYKSNQWLLLQVGQQKRLFEINQSSTSHVTEREFEVYCSRAASAGLDLLRREEVDNLIKRATDQIIRRRITATETENKQHISRMELLYPARVNWTQKRTEARTAIDIKRQEAASARERGKKALVEKYEAEIDKLKQRLEDIERNERKFGLSTGGSSATIFRSLAKRNMALNNTNERLAASRKNLEADATGIDPFARFDTTGQSYFSMKKKGEKGSEPQRPEAVEAKETDWRSCLHVGRTNAKKRKIGEEAVDTLYAKEVGGLDDFLMDVADDDVKKGAWRIPPGIDAMYTEVKRKKSGSAPGGAKIISFEEWSRMRAA